MMIISYPTSASGITVLFKTPPKNQTTVNARTVPKLAHGLTIFVEHGIHVA